ncbi:histone H1.11R [Drosophila mojavensis]|uniref:Uncharacterized protein n=1 Tax=Drosophila mojavensis TaxID=7230 RepID=A0A0Q9WMP0_DROMO|nr:histone H1.11R [Drosophila mojavensis]KRF93981.1 uncharacterized protein Dmoj_GI26387 [Drosophila mojavensis]
MGTGRSKPAAAKAPDRAFQIFLEIFKNTHCYLDDHDIKQNALMTWQAMSPSQKSQFLNFEGTAHAPITREPLPKKSKATRKKSVPVAKARTRAKPKAKPKPTPKPKTAAGSKSLKSTKKPKKAINSTTKEKVKARSTRKTKPKVAEPAPEAE